MSNLKRKRHPLVTCAVRQGHSPRSPSPPALRMQRRQASVARAMRRVARAPSRRASWHRRVAGMSPVSETPPAGRLSAAAMRCFYDGEWPAVASRSCRRTHRVTCRARPILAGRDAVTTRDSPARIALPAWAANAREGGECVQSRKRSEHPRSHPAPTPRIAGITQATCSNGPGALPGRSASRPALGGAEEAAGGRADTVSAHPPARTARGSWSS